MRTAFACLLVVLLAAAPASAQRPASGPPPDSPRELRSDEVTRYVEGLEALAALDDGAEARLVVDPVAARRDGSGLVWDGAVRASLEAQGFEEDSFREVHWNVVAAWASLAWDERRSALAREIETREREEGHLSPSEVEQVLAALEPPPGIADVPPANKPLVAARRARLEPLFER